MLQFITDGIQQSKILRWVIISVISVPFALWGISSYVTNATDDAIATVNGEKINVREYQQEYLRARQRMEQSFGGKLPEAFAQGDFIKQQTLNDLIQQELLLQTIADNGYRMSSSLLLSKLTSYDEFKTDNQFDKEKYQQYLRSVGLSAEQFENTVSDANMVTQMRAGIADTAFVTPRSQQYIEQLNQQTRSFKAASFKTADYLSATKVSEEDLKAYFEAHNAEFAYPEAVKIQYLELDTSNLSESINISDAQLQDLYAEQTERFKKLEQRSASHILLKLDADASDDEIAKRKKEIETLSARIKAGESFEDIAKAYSEDPGSARQGGDLDRVQRGVMVKPFEDALFAMKEANISEPVKTGFGWHLIKLKKIIAEEQQSFDEVKAELIDELRVREADNQFFQQYDVLNNESYENNSTLAPAAEATGLSIKSSGWLERGQPIGVASNAAVREAIFGSAVYEENLNSDLIQIAENHVMVLRINERRPIKRKQFKDVRKDIVKLLTAERAELAAKNAAEAGLAALRSGTDIKAVAKKAGVSLSTHNNVKRTATEPATPLVQAVFSMAKPLTSEASYHLEQQGADYTLLVLTSVSNSTAATVETKNLQTNQPAIEAGRLEYNLWLESVRQNSSITRRDDLL